MATWYWVGASGGTWNTATNWNRDSAGSGITGVPAATDIAVVDKSITAASFVNVNTDVGTVGISQLSLGNLNAAAVGWVMSGTASGTPGTTWTVPVAGATINVGPGAEEFGYWENGFSGGNTITKTGAGTLAKAFVTSRTFGTTNINLLEGCLYNGGANNLLGSGTITMSGGTYLCADGTARSIQNPIVVNGDVTLSLQPGFTTTALGILTLTGTVNIAGAHTITVGGTGAAASNIAVISGAITGAAGFTKAGAGTLTLTGTNSGLLGTITVNGGTLTAGSNGTTGDFGAAANNIVVTSGTASVNRSNAYQIDGSITGAGTFSKVTGTGTLTLTNPTISVSTMTLSAGTVEFSNAGAQNVSSAIGGAAAITKSLGGTLTFSGAGTNTGAWAVNAGTLNVTAAQTGTTGLITVVSGATLTSSAAISKPITISAGSTGNVFTVGGASAVTINGTATVNGNTTGTVVVGSAANATLNGNTGILYYAGTGVVLSPTVNSTSSIQANGTVSSTITLPANRRISTTGTSASLNTYIPNSTATAAAALYQTGAGSVFENTSTQTNGTITQNFGYNNVYGYYLGKAGTVTNRNYFGDSGDAVIDFNGVTASIDILSAAFTSGSTTSNFNVLGGNVAIGTFRTGLSGASVNCYVALNVDGYTGSALNPTAFIFSTSPYAVDVNVVRGSRLGLAYAVSSTPTFRTNIWGGALEISGTTPTTTGTNTKNTIFYGSGNKLGAISGTAVYTYPISPPAGYGVYSVNLVSGGVNYIGPPAIKITTTGSGTGACARAVLDLDPVSPTYQTITNVIITSPGTGYAPGDAILVVGVGGGGTGFSATISDADLTFNASTSAPASYSPDMEFAGGGTLNLAATNTNTGTYTITSGTLSIGNGGAAGTLGFNDLSPVSIASAKTLNFNRSDSRTYTGLISGAGNITKTTSGGTAILNADNTFTGTVTATSGALRAVRAASFGAGSSSLTTASGGAIELDGGITVARPVNLVGTGVGANGALRNITGNNTISGTVAFTTGASIGSNQDTLTLSNTGTVSVTAGTLNFVGAGDVDFSPVLALTSGGVTKSAGVGAAILRGTNTYTGVNTITAGRLGYVGNIYPSVAGNFGNSALPANILIAANAGVRYYGSGSATFSRAYTFQGGAGTANYLESNGTGAVTHSLAPTYATTNVTKTLGLGGSGTAANTIGYVVANNGTGAVSVTKADAGKWILSNTTNSYTGGITVNGGTLGLSVATWTSNASVTNRLTGGAVTVNANAKIQTFSGSGASAQNGRHTYKNLTFAANGRIRIGG